MAIIRYALLLLMAASTAWVQAQVFDFGDAPDPPFPTLLGSNGAAHTPGGLRLGSSIDFEANGFAGPLANGDDANGFPDDEDGIQFTGWMMPGQTATVLVQSSGPAFLDAWIDFQANGNWSDPGDTIFTAQPLTAGANTLLFQVPPAAVNGVLTYARFRLSNTGNVAPVGVVVDGEVEDYRVLIGTPVVAPGVIDPDPGLAYVQNEVSMITVKTTGTLVAAYNDRPFAGGPGLGISYSNDNSTTWTATQLPVPVNGISGIAMADVFDPSVTSNDSGHVFAAHIATDNNWTNGPVSGLYVHKSADGGLTWQSPVTVDLQGPASASTDSNYRFNDRCQIRSDNHPASPYYNRLYVAWIQDRGWNMPQPVSDIYVSSSADGGQTFTPAGRVNAWQNNMGNMPVPDVAANGDVYVLWVDYNVVTGGSGVLLLNKSTDGGATWGNDIVVDTIALPPVYLNGNTDVRAKGAAVLRTHPADSNRLYIVYAAAGQVGDEADIFFITSADKGNTWTAPLRINDDNTLTDQIMPWMEITPNGVIDIAWYDRREDQADLKWSVYAAYSTNGGSSFVTNFKLNTVNFFSPVTPVGVWFGEYLGLTIKGNDVFVGYCNASLDFLGDVAVSQFANPVTGLAAEEEGEAGMAMFPNPARHLLTVEVTDSHAGEPFQLSVYSVTGNCLHRQVLLTGQRHVIDLSDWPAGLYIVSAGLKNQTVYKKLLVGQ